MIKKLLKNIKLPQILKINLSILSRVFARLKKDAPFSSNYNIKDSLCVLWKNKKNFAKKTFSLCS